MQKIMFDLNDKVVVTRKGAFSGTEGVIVEVAVDSKNNTIYGVQINESIVYFLALDLDLI